LVSATACITFLCEDKNSVVGEQSEDQTLVELRFSILIQTGHEAHPASQPITTGASIEELTKPFSLFQQIFIKYTVIFMCYIVSVIHNFLQTVQSLNNFTAQALAC
jgi:hypothetical protein